MGQRDLITMRDMLYLAVIVGSIIPVTRPLPIKMAPQTQAYPSYENIWSKRQRVAVANPE
jgi:hypothetical protein